MLCWHCFSVPLLDHERKVQDNHECLKLNRTLQPLGSARVNLVSNRTYYTTGQTDVGLERNAVDAKMCSVTTTIQDKIIAHTISLEVWRYFKYLITNSN
jgi:hypothetical protein